MARKSRIGSMHPMTSVVTMWPCVDSRAPARKQPSSIETSKNSVTCSIRVRQRHDANSCCKGDSIILQWTRKHQRLAEGIIKNKTIKAKCVPSAWKRQKLPSPARGSPCCLCSQHAASCNTGQSGMLWVTDTAAAQQPERPGPGPGGKAHGGSPTGSCDSQMFKQAVC